ncbi:sulfur reduction protein DsrE [Arsukibacterium ikkense]|uniref:Sulfur reduction protein DsrE n=2 Tax=Arsukibacterium ikkense TaxID=336831 RepID=A0A0M2VAH3_9GAMM|nr:sulfur reduction protein DsrE [Arsukibacterium ikkense]
MLTTSPLAGQDFASALQFARTAIAGGYPVAQVFLYQDAVMAAAATIDLPTDEPNLSQQLADFCQAKQIPLLYCVTAAEKRGLVPATTGFISAGLAEFAIRLANTKLVQF